jgi:hypothetical protein
MRGSFCGGLKRLGQQTRLQSVSVVEQFAFASDQQGAAAFV